MNKKTGAVLLMMLSGSPFAGDMGLQCAKPILSLPCNQSGWDFGAQALRLKTTDMGYSHPSRFANGATYASESQLDLAWGWGFQLQGAYRFGSGNDLDINWFHYGHSTASTVPINGLAGVLASVVIEPKWDAVNAEFGQRVDLGLFKTIRYHAGVQYSRISQNLKVDFSDASTSVNQQLYFKGFGPRMGLDLSYQWAKFKVYAKSATALLLGSQQLDLLSLGINYTMHGSNSLITPELEGRLGVKYTQHVPNGDIHLDVGYLWQNYFKVETITHVFSNQRWQKSTSFALNGPYVGIKYRGYV